MIYVGAHVTENINDSYMGSGTLIREAIKNEGIQNFEKEILFVFENKEQMILKEREIVNEDFLKRSDVYNLVLGGGKLYSEGFVNVKDKNGKGSRVRIDDPRYLSGELVSTTFGKVSVKDKNNNYMYVDINDPRYLSGELVSNMKGKVSVKDKNDNIFITTIDDPRYLSGELKFIFQDKIVVKDDLGKCFTVDKNDPRYLSGELKYFWTGKKHKEETILKMKKSKNEGKENSQFGTCWINNGKIDKKVKKENLSEFLKVGWKKGRINNVFKKK